MQSTCWWDLTNAEIAIVLVNWQGGSGSRYSGPPAFLPKISQISGGTFRNAATRRPSVGREASKKHMRDVLRPARRRTPQTPATWRTHRIPSQKPHQRRVPCLQPCPAQSVILSRHDHTRTSSSVSWSRCCRPASSQRNRTTRTIKKRPAGTTCHLARQRTSWWGSGGPLSTPKRTYGRSPDRQPLPLNPGSVEVEPVEICGLGPGRGHITHALMLALAWGVGDVTTGGHAV